jgi:hypothetical protein
MNLNITFVVSAVQRWRELVAPRVQKTIGCSGCPTIADRGNFRAPRPPALQPRAPVTPAWRGLFLVPLNMRETYSSTLALSNRSTSRATSFQADSSHRCSKQMLTVRLSKHFRRGFDNPHRRLRARPSLRYRCPSHPQRISARRRSFEDGRACHQAYKSHRPARHEDHSTQRQCRLFSQSTESGNCILRDPSKGRFLGGLRTSICRPCGVRLRSGNWRRYLEELQPRR